MMTSMCASNPVNCAGRMTGGELFEYLASREKVDEATATMFLRQVLEGLCHLHEKNIIHLDLKVSGSPFSVN